MGALSKARRRAFRASVVLGDVEAAVQGPGPAARRLVRKRATRTGNRALRRVLRGLGL